MDDNINYISPQIIVPNLYQPRKYFNEDAIDELAKSIKTYGIIQPLTVRKMGNDCFELVAGERRLKAAKKIGLDIVPVIIVDISDSDSAAISLLENLQREDLNFIEEAEAYYSLIQEHNYTQEKLAECIGKKQSTIANKLRLLKLSENIRKVVLDNNLTERHARALLKIGDSNLQEKVLKEIVNKSYNVKETELLIEKELLKDNKNNKEEKISKIKAVFSPKIYLNTVKQMFDKYGINAKYRAQEMDDCYTLTITIPKK